MANWLTCKLTGRHEYTVWCENGAMFLRCSNCGRRSQGWQVGENPSVDRPAHERSLGPQRRAAVSRLSVVRPD